jgi:uncharacterized protein YpmS
MRDLLFVLSTEKKMVRDFVLMALLVVIVSLVLMQVVSALAQNAPSLRASEPQSSGNRTYTISRSILDDTMVTGSVSGQNSLKVQPCGK